jgi:hypothetical protein
VANGWTALGMPGGGPNDANDGGGGAPVFDDPELSESGLANSPGGGLIAIT